MIAWFQPVATYLISSPLIVSHFIKIMNQKSRNQQSMMNKLSTTSRHISHTSILISQSRAQPQLRQNPQQRPMRAEPEKVKLEFKHTFQEYLKLALCKVIPQPGIILDPQEGFIFGAREDCLRIKQKVSRELTSRLYKKVELKRDHDLDKIDYELDSKFDARIFRPAFIKRALDTLSLYPCFETACEKFSQLLEKNIIVILRIKVDFGEECMRNLEDILRKNCPPAQSRRQRPQQNISRDEAEQDYEEVEEQEVNYYQLKESLKKEPEVRPQESSFSWTKTQSSQYSEQESDELNQSCILEDSHYYA